MPDAAGSPASPRLEQAVATPTSSSSSAVTPTGSCSSAVSRKRASVTTAGVGGRSRRSSRHSGELAAYYDFSKRRSGSISVQDEPGARRLAALVMRDVGSNTMVCGLGCAVASCCAVGLSGTLLVVLKLERRSTF
jgi:hypothetical protein